MQYNITGVAKKTYNFNVNINSNPGSNFVPMTREETSLEMYLELTKVYIISQ